MVYLFGFVCLGVLIFFGCGLCVGNFVGVGMLQGLCFDVLQVRVFGYSFAYW